MRFSKLCIKLLETGLVQDGIEVGDAPTLDGVIQLPWDIRGPENENPCVVVTNSVHLDKKLGLYPPRSFRLSLASCTAQRIYFVDEDDSLRGRPVGVDRETDVTMCDGSS